jgi:Na+/melibiose symporter-like transporter
MSTVPYLSALSELASDERSRTRIASWQTFFHTIGYSLAYVLVPMMFGWFGEQMTILILLPTMLTILVPIFIIKEQPTNGTGEKGLVEPHVPLFASLKLTMQNKPFRRYIYVYATLFLGLQLFLQGLRYMAHDMMGLDDQALGTMNAFAFAPIPIMLLIYNFANKRRGPKFSLRTALIAFSLSMVIFTLGWTGFGLPIPPIYLGMIAGIIGSFAIGVFFTVPYAIPSQIAAEEAAVTGKNRAAMYFGVQGLINQVVGIGLSPLAVTLIRGIGSNGPIYIGPAVILVCLISFLLVSGMIVSSKGKVSADKAS